MSMILAILLQAAPNDGLPTFTAEQADAARAKWSDCLNRQADRAAKYTADPSNVVVDVAMELCDVELSNARFAFRRYIIVASPRGLTDDQAKASADDLFAKHVDTNRRYLLTRVSHARQLQALDRERDARP